MAVTRFILFSFIHILLCASATAEDWKVVDLMRLNWSNMVSIKEGVISITESSNASITVSTNKLSGYRSLHNEAPRFESGIFFNITWSERLYCNTTAPAEYSENKMASDFHVNGISVMVTYHSNTGSLFAHWFMLRINSNPNKNILYTLAFSATSTMQPGYGNCTIEIIKPAMIYTPEPQYVSASTSSFIPKDHQAALASHVGQGQVRGIHRRSEHKTSYPHPVTGEIIEISQDCELLGSSHAVLLNQLVVPGVVSYNTTNPDELSVSSTGSNCDSDSDGNSNNIISNSGSTSTADNNNNGQSNHEGVRLFCGIYTTASHHQTHISVIRDTWGHRCTGFMALSTETDSTVPSIAIPHMGEEAYHNMWQKVRSIWKYVHMYYSLEYDYFLLGGDDLYVITENLFEYLNSSRIQEETRKQKGLYLGRVFRSSRKHGHVLFNSGGAGYILDRVALKILVENLDREHCHPHNVGHSQEDVNVALCLAGSYHETPIENNNAISLTGDDMAPIPAEIGMTGNINDKNQEGEVVMMKTPTPVFPFNSTDELGRARFHPFPPGAHWLYQPIQADGTMQNDWFINYDPAMKFGLECCSTRSTSFHYINPALMRDLHNYLYHCSKREKNTYFEAFGELHCDTLHLLKLVLYED